MIYNYDPLSFQIFTVDRFCHSDGVFNVRSNSRPYAALSFRVKGTASFEVEGKRFVSEAGSLLFLPGNTPYKVEYSCSESLVVHLTDCNYTEVENILLENAASVELRFRRLLSSWNEERSVNRAKSILFDLFDLIASDKKISVSDASFSKCLRYMELNFSDPELDVEKVCEYGFVSVSSLQRAFREHLGMSPKQYLIKLRMNKALELLTANELTVKEISFLCGFSDEKYFSRAFKERYGYPPSRLYDNILL